MGGRLTTDGVGKFRVPETRMRAALIMAILGGGFHYKNFMRLSCEINFLDSSATLNSHATGNSTDLTSLVAHLGGELEFDLHPQPANLSISFLITRERKHNL